MDGDGTIVDQFINFRAVITSTTSQIHRRLCAFEVRARVQLSGGNMFTIVLTCDNDNIDQSD